MKKIWTTALLGAALTLTMAACGNNAANNAAGPAVTEAPGAAATASPTAETNETNGAAQGTPTAEELMTRANEASMNLESFAIETDVSQIITMTVEGEQQTQNVAMSGRSEFVKTPLSMHQVMDMSIPGAGEQQIEQYMTEQGVYSKMGDQWIIMNDDLAAEIQATIDQSQNLQQQLEQFRALTDSTVVSEEGDEYVLTADVSGDEVRSLAQSYMNQSGAADPQLEAMMEQMEITNMKIHYAVDKETYMPTRTYVEMSMNMTAEGQEVSLDMTMEGIISEHNEIGPIEVPQEVLDNAQQMPS